MSIVSQHVREFKKVTGQNPTPEMSAKLVLEEFAELWDEVDAEHRDFNPMNNERALKELADLVYVIYAYADTMGWDLDIAINRVHKNNLSRVVQDDGTVKFREDGKVLKNPNAVPVCLRDLV